MNIFIYFSVRQGGRVSIEPLLKLFVYLGAWLNACVAVERSVNVFKGVTFNKVKSKQIARLVVILLPFCVMSSIIHEPLDRVLIEFKTDENKPMKNTVISPKITTLQYYFSTSSLHLLLISFLRCLWSLELLVDDQLFELNKRIYNLFMSSYESTNNW